ncbi:unnamed protein product [Gordionus sp. m RMFG-2023]
MQISVLSIGNDVIYINESYKNTSSSEYQELARLVSLGVEIICRTSELRFHYLRNKVSDIYDGSYINPNLNRKILLFVLILFTPEYNEGSESIKNIFKNTIFSSGCFLGGTKLCIDPITLKVFPASLFNFDLLNTLSSITTPLYIENSTIYNFTIMTNPDSLSTIIPEANKSRNIQIPINRCLLMLNINSTSYLFTPICGDNAKCKILNTSDPNNNTWCLCQPGYTKWGDTIHCRSIQFILLIKESFNVAVCIYEFRDENETNICNPYEFMCNGRVEPRCIGWNRFQDGHNDCSDGVDEICLGWQFDCGIGDKNNPKCILNNFLNNGRKDCLNGIDEFQ